MILLFSVLEQGFIYVIMALGVYITYKILDFPDLTVDGSFPMGAAATALLISKDISPFITLPVSFILGVIVGIITGLIHVKLKVRDLLSGIIMMTALYTINLRIAGRANLPFYQKSTIFDHQLVNSIFPDALARWQKVIILFILAVACKLLLDCYLRTKSGFMLRAVGDNPTLVTSMGIDKGYVKIVGLSIANGLVALSGCLFAQQQRYFDISFGTGTMVIGLASVIIGTSLFKRITFISTTTSVIIGAVVYKGCVALAIRMGMQPSDLKLITAVLFLIILVIGMERKKTVNEPAPHLAEKGSKHA